MGQRGPVPKRSTERRRRNADSKPQKALAPAPPTDIKGAAKETKFVNDDGTVKVPRPAAHWHATAKQWFLSLAESGQAQFYEPSDWQAARYVAEVMSKHLKAAKMSAQLFQSVWTAMGDLLTTEGERRRVRMEIERPDPGAQEQPAGVTALADYKRQLGR